MESKKEAQAAAEAARKALEASKIKEKEVAEELKASMAEAKEKEAEVLQEHANTDRAGADLRKQRKAEEKATTKETMAELSSIEKSRLLREKERKRRCSEAAGSKGRARKLKALTMEPANESPTRGPLPTTDEPPAKAANVEDID